MSVLSCICAAAAGRPGSQRRGVHCAACWLRLKAALACGRRGLSVPRSVTLFTPWSQCVPPLLPPSPCRSPTPTSSSKWCRFWTAGRTWAWCCRRRWAGASRGVWSNCCCSAMHAQATRQLRLGSLCNPQRGLEGSRAHAPYWTSFPDQRLIILSTPPARAADLLQPEPRRRHLQPRQRPLLGLHPARLRRPGPHLVHRHQLPRASPRVPAGKGAWPGRRGGVCRGGSAVLTCS